MKKCKRWLIVSAAFLMILVSSSDAVAPFKKVSIATTTASTTSTITTPTTSTEAPTAEADEVKVSENSADSSANGKNSKLTGIPQIDYIWDPNLPRELRGFNLSTYPFFSTVPPDEDIHFKCDGLHDGFYASIEFKCQVYHHCVYGIRHDFLCANFTAFDQKTFICHFANDVDCENSQKYWSRNDALYMATTTTSTTTTTTEPPPTPRRRPIARPLRPLRRPINRRPSDDYYYDEEDYGDDYYEERINRRRKQRPRQRKPLMDYEDEYEDKRSFADDEKPRRTSSRDRLQAEDEVEEDYDDDRRKHDRPKPRTKPALPAERRKPNSRKPGTIGGRPNPEERRSFSDDHPIKERKEKPKPIEDEVAEPEELPPRRLTGRRRIGDKKVSTAPAADAEEPISAPDQQEAADEEAPPKVKTTPKPLEEFVTPKAAPASVFARPRAPPRISRPVPVTERKKFQYAVQKTATTVAPTTAAPIDGEDYYEDELYDDVRPQHGHPRRRIVDDAPVANRYDDEEEALPQAPARRRGQNDTPLTGRKPARTTIRKPVTEKKPAVVEDEEYDSAGSASNERSGNRANARKRLYSSRNRGSYSAPSARGSDDVDFVDEDYEEQPISRPAHRLKPNTRKHLKKHRLPPPPSSEDEEDHYEPEPEPERPLRSRAGGNIASRRKNLVSSTRQRAQPSEEPSVEEIKDETIPEEEEEAEPPKSAPSKPSGTATGGSRPTSVRVVKRPFLPSRGGSPYLPRGLQPVGAALKSVHSSHTTDSSPVDMGSTISGVRLLEHGAPLLRDSGLSVHELHVPRTTLPPRSPSPIVPVMREEAAAPPPPQKPPKVTLDELYENDYDVTLNDALNPTLKPLPLHQSSPHNSNYQSAFAPPANAFANNQSPANYHNYQFSNAFQVVPQSQQTQTLTAQPHQPHQHQNQSPQQQQQQSPNYNSDSYFSSTDIRRRAIIPASPTRSSRTDYRDVGTRIAQHFYDDIEYN